MTQSLKYPHSLKLGTRGSPLALAQAHETAALLLAATDVAAEIIIFKTTGDMIQDRPLADAGGKGLFTKELDDALLDGRIDIAVHSMKDVPTYLPDALHIAAVLPREDYRDRLISRDNCKLKDLPTGARIGTSSLRRASQLKQLRSDFVIVPFRGNVGTRLSKLEAGEADATILAAAGLNRLGHGALGEALPVGVMLPAVAQGAVGVAARRDDTDTHALLAAIHDLESAESIAIERAFLAELDGSCRTPIAALARFGAQGDVELRGQILSVDGVHAVQDKIIVDGSVAITAARALAQHLRAQTTAAWFAN
jgi:hydroxymethylbilane synthase